MTDDIVARAWAAMEGINTPMPWRFRPWERGVGSSELTGARGVHMAWAIDDGDGTFIAQSPELVAKLVAEVERLREIPAEVRAAQELTANTVLSLWEAMEALDITAERDHLRDKLREAEAERDQLKAAVERVRDLSMQVAHDPDVEGMTIRDFGRIDHALAVLAALDGDDGKGEA